MSSRLRGGTRWLRWTLNPECVHPGAFRRQESLFHQKRDDPCAEKFLQRSEAHVGHHMEKPAVHKEPVGGQRVKVRVDAARDPPEPAEPVIEPWLDDPFPD